MRLPFTKMHGLGNDFIVIQTRSTTPPPASLIQALANRRTGVGFDQLLWVEPARISEASAFYRVFNADGSEAEQCGNGARCVARLIGGGPGTSLVLQHQGGTSRAHIDQDDLVSVELTVPQFDPAKVPFIAAREQPCYTIEADGRALEIGVVSLGNPHGVLRVEDVECAPVDTLGCTLERHERFPNRANIGFMQVLDPGHIRLRVFERGVGETTACGTGACAAVVVGRRAGWLAERVTVSLPGGDLIVSWEGTGSPVWLTGEARIAFEGTVET